MSDSFETVEDELNFILGDGEQLFDIDSTLQDAEGFAALPPATNDGMSSATTGADGSAATSTATADGGVFGGLGKPLVGRQNAIISRMVSISPTFSENEYSRQVLEDFTMEGFNFDIEDDILPPASKNFSGSIGPTSQELNRPFAPSQNNSGQLQQCQSHSHPSPCSFVAFKKKRGRPARKISIPPIVHPEYLATPKRPLRKRKINYSPEVLNLASTTQEEYKGSIQATHVNAMEACQARKKRRLLRAKSQAINLMGGGNILQVERNAVLDSDYTGLSPQVVSVGPTEQALLSDFARNFSPKVFVDKTFEHVYQTLVETSKAEDTAVVPAASQVLEVTNPCHPCPMPIQSISDSGVTQPVTPSNHTLQKPAAVTTSLAKDKSNLKTLPTGKDPESRRLRRLMRNRLSAQASRDKRKKDIEDVQNQKAAKEEEIVLLKKTVSKQIQRMVQLEKAISFARDYICPDQYSVVTGHANMVQHGPHIV